MLDIIITGMIVIELRINKCNVQTILKEDLIMSKLWAKVIPKNICNNFLFILIQRKRIFRRPFL